MDGSQNIEPVNHAQIEHMVRCLVDELNSVAQNTPAWSIYRVPKRLCHVNQDEYMPHLVSIGPLHHGKINLSSMEEYKKRYMLALLTRTGNSVSRAMESCVIEIMKIEALARNCCAEDVQHDRFKLAKIFLIDGCFIIELLLRSCMKNQQEIDNIRSWGLLFHPPDHKNDPIFRSEWMISTLRRDLALLENQIPFFVLDKLLNNLAQMVAPRAELNKDTVATMAFHFFEPALHSKQVLQRSLPSNHLLQLLLNYHLPALANGDEVISGSCGGCRRGAMIPNVTMLKEVCIKVRKGKAEDLFSFKFDNGVLEIPPLHILEWSESLFRNLMAFEYCYHSGREHIASYLVLMDRLIDTKEDVMLLEQKGIITNELGGGEYVVDFFKSICKQVVVKNFYFQDLCEQVDLCYQSRWRRYVHDLKRMYFANPWKTISLSAAAVILGLTAIQTVYTVLSYYSH